MTVKEIKKRLQTDPVFLINTIVHNNPEAVAMQLQRYIDVNYTGPAAMANALVELYNSGEKGIVIEALSVPFNYENATPELIQAKTELTAEKNAGKKVSSEEVGQWAMIAGGVLGALGGVMGGTQGSNVSNQQNNQQSAPPQKDYTIYYVIGGVVLLIIGVVLFKMKK